MRVAGLFLLLVALCFAGDRRDARKPGASGPTNGVHTPGIQIPFDSLQPEMIYELPATPAWLAFTDAIWVGDKDGLLRIDPRSKESKLGGAAAKLKQPCAGMASGFNSLWAPNCADGSVVRLDARTRKVATTIPSGTGEAKQGIAATTDSVWMLSDAQGTLSRIDPDTNTVVAELRVYRDCGGLLSAESALWLACPQENTLMRVDPETNLIDKTIKVAAKPYALAAGENSIWVLCASEGKVDRVDPKSNKVIKTIDLGAPASGGSIAFGEGSLWVSMPGFPLTRIDPAGETVTQQFWGEAFGVVQTGGGFIWLTDAKTPKLRKLDPKRIAATLAE